MAWRDGVAYAARLRACSVPSAGGGSLARGVYAITGGLGGLGLRAAALLIERGAERVILASRSGRVVRDGQGLASQLALLGASAEATACDSAEALDVGMLLGRAGRM